MSDNRVTIICCYNNEEQYKSELIASIELQTEKCDVIALNNTENLFKSSSEAFNSVMNKIKTRYVVFSHQDICMTKGWSLSKFIDYMTLAKVGDIYGVAGTSLQEFGVLSAIYHGKNQSPAWERKLTGIQKCDTIDECFFGGMADTFRRYPFNEKLCNNWHLYAVERCLNNRLYGHEVYVCEIPLIHLSKGKINREFNINFRALCKSYSRYYTEIYTTCARSKTDIISRNVNYLKMELKRILKHE